MRSLTDYQWIILWEIEDRPAAVWRRDEEWFLAGPHQYRDRKVTLQIKALLQRDLVSLTSDREDDLLRVGEAGKKALSQRDYKDVLNRWNAR